MINWGGSRIFSRGGGGRSDFQKNFENFDNLFFDWLAIDYLNSPNALKKTLFRQNFLRRR